MPRTLTLAPKLTKDWTECRADALGRPRMAAMKGIYLLFRREHALQTSDWHSKVTIPLRAQRSPFQNCSKIIKH